MKLFRLKTIVSLLLLAGCVESSYPLIKKEESVSFVPSGNYCFVPARVSVSQDSQCGWLRVNQNQENGYKFEIIRDGHETITGSGSNIRKDTIYFARILNAPIGTGHLKDWHVIQSCASANRCEYFALQKREDGVFDVAVTPSPEAGLSARVSSKAELLSHFSALIAFPDRVVRFYSPQYLAAKSNERARRRQLIKEKNEGDL